MHEENTGSINPSQMIDILYGPCRDAGDKASSAEKSYSPRSRTKLTAETAPLIREYLKTATDGFSVPRVLHQTTNLLWLVDAQGDIWIAVEEMINPHRGQYTVCLRTSRPEGYEKLGHPALISGVKKEARLAGEIMWDDLIENVPSPWVLMNNSGRYGGRADQREPILQVAKRFAEHDISLTPVLWDEATKRLEIVCG